MPRPVKVLLVDDSSVVLGAYKVFLGQYPGIEVVGTAQDPYEARKQIFQTKPDVLVLDIHMPKMDGITFLRHLMKRLPTPVIIVSKFADTDSDIALEAKNYGAIAVMGKVNAGTSHKEYYDQLAAHIRAASKVNVRALTSTAQVKKEKFTTPVPSPLPLKSIIKRELIIIGCSTGGPQSLERIMTKFPKGTPGMIIVQHMPANFTGMLAHRLDKVSDLSITEAMHGNIIEPGCCLIAPGERHLEVRKRGDDYVVALNDGPRVHGVKPSVDIALESVAACAPGKATVAILTGMGRDGAEGAKKMHAVGNPVIAQDEETSIVFGMPREAIATGIVYQVKPLEEIPQAILNVL